MQFISVKMHQGQRYLWVGTLCIVQYHKADQRIQVRSMGLIYFSKILDSSWSVKALLI